MNVYTTYSSQVLDLDFIKTEDIHIKDIAHSLSFQCRFNGHTERFYSIAEHSIILRDLVVEGSVVQNLNRRMAALLHDSAECYIGDITKPVREHFYIGESFEDQILKIVFEAFGVPFSSFDEELKAMDNDLCIVEGFLLIGGMYWSKAYYELVKRNPIFAIHARDMIISHNGNMWEEPSHIAQYFKNFLEEEWKNFSTLSETLEEPNVEPAE